MKFVGDIIITDPCYIMREDKKFKYDPNKDDRDDDWARCGYGSHMEVLGIKNYLTESTIYGDWSCTTYQEETGRVLGHFCADAGLVSVFLLDEVLKYNPNFMYHLNKGWTTTLIKNFNGDVVIELVEFKYKEDDEEEERTESEMRVIGKGSINFYTSQTGL